MKKLQKVNKIVIKMLNKHENQRKESRNVKISENITKKSNVDVIDQLEYYTTYPKTTNFCKKCNY